MKFLYKLFRLTEPVCETCEVLKAELAEFRNHIKQPCNSCEILKVELESERHEKRRLLDKLLFPPEPKPELELEEIKPHLPRHTPWSIRQALLEKESREEAKVLAELEARKPKPQPVTTIAKLEDELLKAPDNTAKSGGQIFQEVAVTEQDFEEVDDATGT
jgi:hypothetical protein